MLSRIIIDVATLVGILTLVYLVVRGEYWNV